MGLNSTCHVKAYAHAEFAWHVERSLELSSSQDGSDNQRSKKVCTTT